eukprot:TRINITY_DN9644_c0_g1_i1.p1 TRINITY_DN9644_c0_g1~~TRINITY_DN9644_c0_g1_i1.p1  ORF type:complete len:244 (+),score=4.13 TRINITY_DN9644_c0_g1_i1:26-757(+)
MVAASLASVWGVAVTMCIVIELLYYIDVPLPIDINIIRPVQTLLLTVSAASQRRTKGNGLLAVAFFFSFIGDVINSQVYVIPQKAVPQQFFSIPPFAIAHILFCKVFSQLSVGTVGQLVKTISYVVLIPFSCLTWSFVFPSTAKPFDKVITLAYAHILHWMLITSLWLPLQFGARSLTTPLGALIFLISDCLIALWQLFGEETKSGGQIIWCMYFLGQALIALAPERTGQQPTRKKQRGTMQH